MIDKEEWSKHLPTMSSENVDDIKIVLPIKNKRELIYYVLEGYYPPQKTIDRHLYTCPFCLFKESIFRFQVSHDEAKSKGGNDSFTNLILLCQSCNDRQGTNTFDEFLADCKYRDEYVYEGTEVKDGAEERLVVIRKKMEEAQEKYETFDDLYNHLNDIQKND